MATYSVLTESARVLNEHLLESKDIHLPQAFKEAAKLVKFVGSDIPFIPTLLKITESSSALNALVAIACSAISKDRYGIDYQNVEVNIDVASLFLMSLILATINGKSALENSQIQTEIEKGNHYAMEKPIHRQCTNVYQTKDGRHFHLHGSMNATAAMKMVGAPEQDVFHEEAREIYMAKVAEWNADDIDRTSNDEYRQAGVICSTPDEFFASEQGRAMEKEPLYRLKKRSAPISSWPSVKDSSRPLAGIRVTDFLRVIAGPVISKVLAILGAEVLKVTNDELPDITPTSIDFSVGKRDTNLNLKFAEGRQNFQQLIDGADVLIDGYCPGALEKIGFNADSMWENNPSLIYLREKCCEFAGPLAYRSGWQQISDCLVALAWLQGEFFGLNEPVLPLLPNSDYQMGLAGAAAVCHALFARTKEAVTFDIDISLTQYNIWYYRLGLYDSDQQKVLLKQKDCVSFRDYDDMSSLIMKTFATVKNCRPDLFEHPEYFQEISGKEWGIQENIKILSAPFKLSNST
ncbi:uncharacterized protein N7483_003032 [Penicillium malachiteum]|uniref:uncharacterized protein n=1 Tax=Penicillium malachiteum TaxID=1324776 RepID=UPI002546DB1F|nr:uncharacterized protein N7483_003032 [Penicillium malachiteum]KAJ5737907.1 hypothetical protein N7483_003032 [Penicillium malachiteum]